MAPLLGYWNIRGFGQTIRLILAYAEEKVEEKRYNIGPPPEFDRSEWLNEKFSLGLDFPNLPYYIDGDVKMTQSLAIMHYLARKLKLDPETEDGKIRADMVMQQISDFRMGLAKICYNPDYENLRVEYLKTLPALLKAYSDFLGKRKWFAGDKLTYADFMVYESLDYHKIFAPGCVNDYKNLKDFLDRFENLPTIKKYMKSEDFIKWPLNADMAIFGSKHTKP